MADDPQRKYNPERLISPHYIETIPAEYKGMVYYWDIDKTYLDTKFESFTELLKIPLEKAKDKRNVPGAVSLLKGLRHGNKRQQGHENYIYFISSSPTQLRKVLEHKMQLDQIDVSGTFFKNQMYNIRKRRFRRLTQQLGYKLSALLGNRLHWKYNHAGEILFGDSSESDIIVYSLYDQILAKTISRNELRKVLGKLGLLEQETDYIDTLVKRIYEEKLTTRVLCYFILFAKEHSVQEEKIMYQFHKCLPIHNYFEAALHCYELGVIQSNDVIEVGQEMIGLYNFSKDQLSESITATQMRNKISSVALRRLELPLKNANLIATALDIQPMPYWKNISVRIRHSIKRWAGQSTLAPRIAPSDSEFYSFFYRNEPEGNAVAIEESSDDKPVTNRNLEMDKDTAKP